MSWWRQIFAQHYYSSFTCGWKFMAQSVYQRWHSTAKDAHQFNGSFNCQLIMKSCQAYQSDSKVGKIWPHNVPSDLHILTVHDKLLLLLYTLRCRECINTLQHWDCWKSYSNECPHKLFTTSFVIKRQHSNRARISSVVFIRPWPFASEAN